MRNFTRSLSLFVLAFTIFSCTKNAKDISIRDNVSPEIAGETNSGNQTSQTTSSPYIVTLEGRVDNGDHTWTWTWSVQNPNPGNGTNGTAQNLSHWGFVLGSCVNFADVTAAGYSFNGTDWTNFSPSYAVDPSQSCMTNPVFKFDIGTTGSAKTYYRLVMSANYAVDPYAQGYYKSGSRTGCGLFQFSGIGCLDDIHEIHELQE